MWKNGQCVTVKGKRYRVKSSNHPIPCPRCALWGECESCNMLCSKDCTKLGLNQYLEEICGKTTKE